MEEETKNKILSITEKELKNPQIRRALVNFVNLRAGFHSTKPFFEISEAELEIMKSVPLFTPIEKYGGNGKYPNEVGKYKSQRVVVR